MLTYPCLVLDHDDTLVNSTRSINFPQFRSALPKMRPSETISEDEFIRYCCDYGFYGMCREVYRYTEEELQQQIEHWQAYVAEHRAEFFPGIPQILRRQKEAGGMVCVVTHNYEAVVRSLFDYRGVTQPDLVFGSDYPPEQCKPSPWPLQELMRREGFRPEQILVVDDMPLGMDMAHACGVSFAAAAWYGMPDFIRRKMAGNCEYFLEQTADLSRLLFGDADGL